MSEVARIRQQIEVECEALRLIMHGVAFVASHDIVRNRYRNLDRCREELAVHIGEPESEHIVIETYIKTVV